MNISYGEDLILSIFPGSQKRFGRYLITVALVAIAYMGSAHFTLLWLGLGAEASPVWVSAGIALAVLFLEGKRLWIGVAIGAFWLNLSLGASFLVSLGSVIGCTLQAVVGAMGLRRLDFNPTLEHLKDAFALIIVGALIAPSINATISTVVNCWVGFIPWHQFGLNWGTLWLGDSMGILVFTPLLLLIAQGFPQGMLRQNYSPHTILEAVLCGALLWMFSWLVFQSRTIFALSDYPLEYLPFPFVAWAALRFRVWGAVFASVIVSGMAIGGAIQGIGPFVVKTGSTQGAILLLQTFLAVVTVTAFVLAAAMSERQQAEARLRATLERDRLLAEIALRIRQSLDLDQIFQTTVVEVRQLLQADRVYISYLDEHNHGKIAAESVASAYKSMLGWKPSQKLLQETQELFSQRQILIRDNTDQVNVTPYLKDFYRCYQIKATLAIPLILDDQLFGLLAVHQCHHSRHWKSFEVDWLRRLAVQVTIALQQAQLYQQVQDLNSNLESQVAERTLQLEEKMQELQRLYELKDVFLQAVSHDLRTSMMGLILMLKGTQNCPGETVALPRRILERLIENSDRQLTLINALSEDHFNQGLKIELHCQPLCLNELLSQILADLQRLLTSNQAKLTLAIPPNLPPVKADPTQLRCVFQHLLTNALKHNLPGVNITLTVRVEGDRLYCAIADDGVGMSKQQCDRLFKLYVRGLHSQHLTGIGLGLYLCRQIINAHGGQISVTSAPRAGSTFEFTLPFQN